MFRISVLLLLFICPLYGCFCEDEHQDLEKKVIMAENIPVVLIYQPSGKTYYNEIDKRNEQMLESISYFYRKDDLNVFLGKVTTNGVFNAKNELIFKLPNSLEGAYVSIRNLDYPNSVNFIEFKDGYFSQTDTILVIRVNTDLMSIEQVIPKI